MLKLDSISYLNWTLKFSCSYSTWLECVFAQQIIEYLIYLLVMLLWVYIHAGQAWKICLATVGIEPSKLLLPTKFLFPNNKECHTPLPTPQDLQQYDKVELVFLFIYFIYKCVSCPQDIARQLRVFVPTFCTYSTKSFRPCAPRGTKLGVLTNVRIVKL
jgi:hypothetical protein